MFEMVKAGGWLMLPIILCSVMALAIIVERLWSLQRRKVIPGQLVAQIWQWAKEGQLNDARVRELRQGSPLGRVLAAGLANRGLTGELALAVGVDRPLWLRLGDGHARGLAVGGAGRGENDVAHALCLQRLEQARSDSALEHEAAGDTDGKRRHPDEAELKYLPRPVDVVPRHELNQLVVEAACVETDAVCQLITNASRRQRRRR